ncbi:MAG: hypothetical protein ACRBBS_10750 [Thalassovita sp.]
MLEKAFDVSIENLKGQKEDLRSVRSQSAFSAAIASLIASFFGGMVGSSGIDILVSDSGVWGFRLEFLLAMVAFSSSIGCSILVSVKVGKVAFEANPLAIIYWKEHENYVGQGYKMMAKRNHLSFRRNEFVIDEARCYLWSALVSGFVQIPFWIMLVGNR